MPRPLSLVVLAAAVLLGGCGRDLSPATVRAIHQAAETAAVRAANFARMRPHLGPAEDTPEARRLVEQWMEAHASGLAEQAAALRDLSEAVRVADDG